ncbi:hypothetical protein BDD12DRAFT_807886 [Trichophaea hybrida]|nr:hypothetical protein BDD12DRAFT_807886 [Trichophaea hybrida]
MLSLRLEVTRASYDPRPDGRNNVLEGFRIAMCSGPIEGSTHRQEWQMTSSAPSVRYTRKPSEPISAPARKPKARALECRANEGLQPNYMRASGAAHSTGGVSLVPNSMYHMETRRLRNTLIEKCPEKTVTDQDTGIIGIDLEPQMDAERAEAASRYDNGKL